MYDVTDRKSFEKITEWMKTILSYNTKEKIGLILLANKVDSETREVNTEEGNNLAKEFGINFFETSALNNYNLDEAFSCMVEEIAGKKKIEVKQDKNRITLTREKKEEGVVNRRCFC